MAHFGIGSLEMKRAKPQMLKARPIFSTLSARVKLVPFPVPVASKFFGRDDAIEGKAHLRSWADAYGVHIDFACDRLALPHSRQKPVARMRRVVLVAGQFPAEGFIF